MSSRPPKIPDRLPAWLRSGLTLGLAALALTQLPPAARADDRWAPNVDAGAVDQLVLAGNACGPAALLAAARCGDDRWQALAARLPGQSDKSKLLYIIRAHGLTPSTSLQDRRRWTRDGINAEDLHAIAVELAEIGGIPRPRSEGLFVLGRESPARLLKRTHDRLRDSLAKGMPPILSLTRQVRRQGRWQVVQSHFVTVVRVPEKLDRGATRFRFTYLDPWGGKRHEGSLELPRRPLLAAEGQPAPCLEALVPEANIGRSKVGASETHAVIPAQVIGRW